MGKIIGFTLLIIGILWIGMIILTVLVALEPYREFLGENGTGSAWAGLATFLTMSSPGIIMSLFGLRSIIKSR